MRSAAVFIVAVLCSFQAASQQASPMARYNAVADRMYQLERCNEMTQERWAWLENVRTRAMRALGWSEIVTQEHDKLLILDFNARYSAGIGKDRCNQLARAIDLERKSAVKVPPQMKRP